jgi:hypothetical protein
MHDFLDAGGAHNVYFFRFFMEENRLISDLDSAKTMGSESRFP